MKTFVLASLLTIGCATSSTGTTDTSDGLDITSTPGHVSGTFTREGLTVEFDFTPSNVTVRTVDRAILVEGTLEDELMIMATLRTRPEAVVVRDLFEAIADDGVIACPTAPKHWKLIADRAADRLGAIEDLGPAGAREGENSFAVGHRGPGAELAE